MPKTRDVKGKGNAVTPEEMKQINELCAQPEFRSGLMCTAMTNHIARHHGYRAPRRTKTGLPATEKFGEMTLTWDATHLIAPAPDGRTEVRLVIVTREPDMPPRVAYGPPLYYSTPRAALAALADES
jgi:hypothetical protein